MSRYSVFPQKPVVNSRYDVGFIACIVILLGLGLVTLYITSTDYATRIFNNPLYFVKRQAIGIAVGLVFLFMLSWIDLDIVRKLLPFIVIAVFVLCFFPFIPGIGIKRNGASRWIRVPFFVTFQPSEAAKLAVVLFLSNLFAKKHDRLDNPSVSLYPAAVGVFAFVLIVFLQDDFSTAVFILITALCMFFIVGIKIHWFMIFILLTACISVLFIFDEPYRANRVIAFLKPELDINGLNYQIRVSRRAVSAGGFWGQGIGGVQRINAIPEVQADFIFAGWAEAMGLVGVIIYLCLLSFFAWKAFSIAFKCTDRFRSLCAFGCALIIVLQSLINIAVVSGALPATGIPLPFFSSGGSSMLITLCLCGILINISRYKNAEDIGAVYE
ncbi:cell division protein FtsW [Treponema sp. OMZ 840]|uniref:peptidoglycan glycosyltransferase FtsW n=1 Tax=Treponema sp. OMZ 840 TaxID=244313 RepID=UPI003D93CCCB